MPLVGTIVAVTFIGGYIPYIGAWSAGVFAVLLALGGAGTDAAGGMIVVQLLANGALQQLVQPFAMGAALGLHPLAVLIVTIAGGALFGTVGLILAAPLTSAIVKISADLAQARAKAEPATTVTIRRPRRRKPPSTDSGTFTPPPRPIGTQAAPCCRARPCDGGEAFSSKAASLATQHGRVLRRLAP